MMREVAVTGSFDDFCSRHVRFLEEASKLGNLSVLMWSDEVVRKQTGKAPKFPEAERLYTLQAIRYVCDVVLIKEHLEPDALPHVDAPPQAWVVDQASDNARKRAFCRAQGMAYRLLKPEDLSGFPVIRPDAATSSKKVIVTGCFDWFHSGHVRFFEEVSALGELTVVVGHDANIRLLKGEGHPMIPQDERRYMVQAVRYVHQALISSGQGWMDAEPEIARIKPDIYAVNADGDVPEKREFCQDRGLRYVVLKRTPKEGLPRRQSTDLRGF
jgi:cytidyltransferase-like protein